jgi:hypothetical protein
LRWVPPGYLRTAIGGVLILFSPYNIKLFAVGLPILAVGMWVGWTVYGKLDEVRFRKGVLVLLLMSGVALAIPLKLGAE